MENQSKGCNWIYKITFLTVFTSWYINMVSFVKTVSFSRYKKTLSYKQDLAVISLFLTFFTFDICVFSSRNLLETPRETGSISLKWDYVTFNKTAILYRNSVNVKCSIGDILTLFNPSQSVMFMWKLLHSWPLPYLFFP